MADFYVDFNGNVSTKKKKKVNQGVGTASRKQADYSVGLDGTVTKNYVAPVTGNYGRSIPGNTSATYGKSNVSGTVTPTVTPTTSAGITREQQARLTAEENILKKYGTYEQFRQKNAVNNKTVQTLMAPVTSSDAMEKMEQGAYEKLIQDETNRLLNAGYSAYGQYVDNIEVQAQKQTQAAEGQKLYTGEEVAAQKNAVRKLEQQYSQIMNGGSNRRVSVKDADKAKNLTAQIEEEKEKLEYMEYYSEGGAKNSQKKQEWTTKQRENLEKIRDMDDVTREMLEVYLYGHTKDGEDEEQVKKTDRAGGAVESGRKKAAKKSLKEKGYSDKEIASLADTLERAENAEDAEEFRNRTEKNVNANAGVAILANAASVGANLVSGAGMVPAAEAWIKGVVTGEYTPIDTNDPLYRPGEFRDIVRQTTSQNIENSVDNKVLKKVLPMAYNAGMSTADTFTASALGGTLGGGAKAGEVLSLATMSAGAASSGTQEVFERTGNTGKALASGVTSGAIEYLTEKVSLDHLWDIIQKSGSTAGKKVIVNLLAQAGIEGSEEGASEILNRITDNCINGKDSQYNQNVQQYMEQGLDKKEATTKAEQDFWIQTLESFAVGSMAGLMGGGLGTIMSTGPSKESQAVMDAEFDSRVAEKEKSGKKLKMKEKAAIREQVESDLAKGRISIDTIEKILGGETYEKYRSAVEQEETLTKEFDTLNKMKQGEMTGEQIDRRAELKEQLAELKKNSNKEQLKEQLSQEVEELAANDGLLRESYNERGRRREAYQIDENAKYSDKQREIIQKAADSGILNNTRRTHEFVDMIAKISADKGVSFEFANNEKIKQSGFALEGKTVNGFVKDGNITLNVESNQMLEKVAGHEITHVLEGTELYSALQQAVKEYATTKGEYDTRLQALTELYKGVEDANVENELTADLVGEYLFTDEDFVKNLSVKNQNLFQRIYSEIKYMLKTATAGSKEARQLEKVKHLFEEAYRENGKANLAESVTKFSLSANQHLDQYSERQRNNWKNSKKIVLCENEAQMLDFIEKAKNRENPGQKLYFGIIKNEVAERVRTETGYDIHGYNCALYSDNIRKIFKDHGSEVKEAPRGQRAVEVNDFTRIPEIVSEAETIKVAGMYGNQVAIEFKKDGITIIGVISDGALDLYTQTMYVSKKNRSLATAIDEQAPINTPATTRSTASTDSVPQNQQNASGNSKSNDAAKYHVSSTFSEEIDKALNNRMDSSNQVKARDYTPEILVENGVENLPMLITQKHVRTIVYTESEAKNLGLPQGNNVHYHGLGKELLMKAVDNMDSPSAIYKQDNEHYLVITELQDSNSNAIIVPVKIDGKGTYNNVYIDENQILSVYGKSNLENYLQKNNYQKIYPKKGTTLNERVQFPDISDSSKDSVPQNQQNASGNSKKSGGATYSLSENTDATQSQQFKRWFGDWQNHPESASKVVNEDGTPKVVYHGTGSEFYTFDEARQGENYVQGEGGFFFTTSRQSAERYARLASKDGNDHVVEAYLSIKKPYEVQAYGDYVQAPAEKYDDHRAEYLNEAEINGCDGIIITGEKSTLYVVFDSTQIKSATDNIGSFDGSNPDIRYSLSNKDDIAPIDSRYTYGRDIALEQNQDIAPIRKDIAGKEIAPAQKQQTSGYDIAPIRSDIDTRKANAETKNYDIAPIRSDIAQEEIRPSESPKTVKELNQIKRDNYRIELERLQKEAKKAHQDFNRDIAEKQAEYDRKKNKNTKVARELQSRIDSLKTKRDNSDAYFEMRMNKLQEQITKMNTEEFKRAEQRMMKQDEYRGRMRELMGDTSTWKDKKMGISYQINTLKRNLRDIVRTADGKHDIARADAIYEELQGKYNHNEALLNREANSIKDKYRELKINSQEDAYIQMLGEYKYNPDCTLTPEEMEAYYKKNKDKINLEKVEGIIEDARKLYDSLFERVNGVLREQGMKEIGYREGYFPHFTQDKQSFLAKLFNWKTKSDNIPTDIAGLTENFNPDRSWQSFNKHRTGDDTVYSFKKGLDSYVNGALDWIYHIEDIQKRRAFENEIRYQHSETGVQEKVQKILNDTTLDADEVQQQIDAVYAEANNPLNNFVTDFRNATNNLAGKKSTADRGLEYATNRKIYSTMTNLSNRVSANMVGGSISSALTNFIPITQSWGEVSPVSSLKAMRDTIKSYIQDDGMVSQSDFMTNRLNQPENLYQNGWDKANKAVGIMMDCIDGFTTQVVWRSKYIENVKSGMSQQEAIRNADNFAEGLMAGRSRGNMPTIFNSKNPVTKLFTAFQLEVANQYGYMFKDMPQNVGSRSMFQLTKGYASMFIGAYLYNALYSSLTGRDAAFDPIGIIEDLLKDLGVIGDDDDDDKEKDVLGAMGNLAENLLDETPFVGGLLGGGRVPISAALPYDDPVSMVKGTFADVSKGDWKGLTKEWLNPVYYLAMPMGGGQLRKTVQGLSMFNDDLPVSGSYTGNGDLRFPVEDTMANRIQAGIFGQYANKNARAYFDGEHSPLNEKQIQEYKDLDIPIQDYWKYREGLKGLNKMEDKTEYIAGLDLPISKKNILINNASSRKEHIDLTGYENFKDFEEFDFSIKNPAKYEFLKDNDISYEKYSAYKSHKEAYDWAYQNQDKFEVAKAAAGGAVAYRKYAKAIDGIKADQDSSGKAVSGSRKKKVTEYINGLDLDYGQKLLLYKDVYTNDNTYNQEIVDYLNSREDISYHGMETILRELGFTVEADGTVRW